ncbi:MAG: GGDEF domain-containing protein [Pseudomonadota bacterium]
MPRKERKKADAPSWEELARELAAAAKVVGKVASDDGTKARGLAFLVEDAPPPKLRDLLDKVDLVIPLSNDAVTILQSLKAIVLENRKLKELSVTDTLTGLYNRRFFLERLQVELERVRRTEKPCGLIMFDLDKFKQVNDVQGHQAGDELLRRVGGLIKQSVRAVDLPVRYGGDEFAVILPDAGSRAAFKMAERIRTNLIKDPLISTAGVTGSFGLASHYHHSVESLEDMVQRADQALYHSKSRGGNQTYLFEQDMEKPTEVTVFERDELYFPFVDD